MTHQKNEPPKNEAYGTSVYGRKTEAGHYVWFTNNPSDHCPTLTHEAFLVDMQRIKEIEPGVYYNRLRDRLFTLSSQDVSCLTKHYSWWSEQEWIYIGEFD